LHAEKINNGITAPPLQRTAMLPTGRCHITLFPREKSAHCDAAYRQNSLTTCLTIQAKADIPDNTHANDSNYH